MSLALELTVISYGYVGVELVRMHIIDKYVKTKYLGKFWPKVGRGERERNCITSAGIVGTVTYMYGYDGLGM